MRYEASFVSGIEDYLMMLHRTGALEQIDFIFYPSCVLIAVVGSLFVALCLHLYQSFILISEAGGENEQSGGEKSNAALNETKTDDCYYISRRTYKHSWIHFPRKPRRVTVKMNIIIRKDVKLKEDEIASLSAQACLDATSRAQLSHSEPLPLVLRVNNDVVPDAGTEEGETAHRDSDEMKEQQLDDETQALMKAVKGTTPRDWLRWWNHEGVMKVSLRVNNSEEMNAVIAATQQAGIPCAGLSRSDLLASSSKTIIAHSGESSSRAAQESTESAQREGIMCSNQPPLHGSALNDKKKGKQKFVINEEQKRDEMYRNDKSIAVFALGPAPDVLIEPIAGKLKLF